MKNPSVSFVVPCYNLAEFLPKCIDSILAQSFYCYEVLIMDDCSPDSTQEVARSYNDPRIQHIRNESNLGPLRNYNKGIELVRGKYIWLISADDYLRNPAVVERYVELMERHPRIGYAFCPGVRVIDGKEAGMLEYSTYGSRDCLVDGHAFLKKILDYCFILAPSVMVRRQCYAKISVFPLDVVWAGELIDLIWGGDWYLWCLFALHYDVAYFAEPMVCYREHNQSYTTIVTRDLTLNCIRADIAVPWMIKKKADEAGMHDASGVCLRAIAKEYVRHLSGKWYRTGVSTITVSDFEESLGSNTGSDKDKNWIRNRVMALFCATKADQFYNDGNHYSARELYWTSLRYDPSIATVYVKIVLLAFGALGRLVRKLLVSSRCG